MKPHYIFPYIALLACLAIIFPLCGCGDNSREKDNKASDGAALSPQKPAEGEIPSPISPGADKTDTRREATAKTMAAEEAAGAETDKAPDTAAPAAIGRGAVAPPDGESANGAIVEIREQPSRQELDRADKILAFHNQAQDALERGYFALPRILHANSRQYLRTWRLPRSTKTGGKKRANALLKPRSGIFSEAEERQLTVGLLEMNHALEEMIGHYRQLEKYVADDTIHDDGRLGMELAGKIEASHTRFMKARDSWREIVLRNAEKAEATLLREHPLQRQIIAASRIFSAMGEAGNILRLEEPEKSMLEAVHQNLDSTIAHAGKPPFNAAPALERLYRHFLKTASLYAAVLQRGIDEGLRSRQKREIREAAAACRAAYNSFAKQANSLSP